MGKRRQKPEEDGMESSGMLLEWMEAGANTLVKVSMGRILEKGHPKWLDIYILSWLFLQIAVIIALAFSDFGPALKILFTILFVYRLVEIGITNFDSVFIKVMQRQRHRSVPRLFSLIMVNYIEVILVFGIIYKFLIQNSTLAQSFNYSVSLATLSGLTFDNPTTALYVAGIFEMILGIFFVTGVIAAIANYIGSKE